MSAVTVVTAVFDGGHQHLRAAYESLLQQDLPAGWTWEWCVQEDGDTGVARRELPDDPRISHGTGLPGRAAVARTMALARANGELVRCLDADDLLLPGALARDIEALHRAAWCVSACLDLHPDGSVTPGPYDPPDGPVAPGRFLAEQREDRLSVQASTFAAHTGLVRALGGWPALTGAETVGLLLAAEAVAPGEFIARPSMLYRKHDGQTTADGRYWADEEHAARLSMAVSRTEELRRAGWRWPFDGR
ncbi:glycosyltransferase family 2 protein [Amycolatopsis suaedae]|uniref:Glycosyltransferase family 2 protein n=1 Tax=Amycolatopsis suaedae TaxID=2510978 RepID=A0A4Q7JCF4_9PSEU|nr:glycosyltransferase family A protein [Amycolatopsis suaedae]RZQ64989.1 glycosyltransferase family 2 protein [Amycolatopsis suaedae]